MKLEGFLKELEKYTEDFTPEALEFYTKLKEEGIKSNKITEKGLKVLAAMQENQARYSNIFSAKQLGELLFMAPRSVSGSMKKLITDGYVEKRSLSPVTYGLTELGLSASFDNE